MRGAVVELPGEGAVLEDGGDVAVRGQGGPALLAEVTVLAGVGAPQAWRRRGDTHSNTLNTGR